ncbi:MAG: smalltalk protein [Bacteroidales bacterium]|nr:smalltalk protein [Bacteroidales bacterium]MCI7686817.1 smalltalk protein [Prevotella sp.]MDD6745219.1 smalltalk protein [Bacteroidales bacterium]
MKRETWKTIVQLLLSVLTAVATTLGITSCCGLL